jgi:hypothetical protein
MERLAPLSAVGKSMRMKLTIWLFALAWVPLLLVNAADERLGTTNTLSGTVSNATPGFGRDGDSGGSEQVLNKVISRASTGGDGDYDTNLTEKVLQKVTALGGKIKQDNRWIIIRVLNMKENDLVLGLSAFLKYSRGKYPSALTGNTMCEELVKLVDRSPVQGKARETEEQFKKEFVNAMSVQAFSRNSSGKSVTRGTMGIK